MSLIHTCYRILDIDRSVAFYEALGFEEVRRAPIRDEATNVFMITTEDLDGTLAQLSEQGIEPERPPYTVRAGGNRLCFVRDPDGYRIELIERG
jgi:lactoylglutathione lyase